MIFKRTLFFFTVPVITKKKQKMAGKCETCRKEVGIRRKECDESGLAWHSNCFYCRRHIFKTQEKN